MNKKRFLFGLLLIFILNCNFSYADNDTIAVTICKVQNELLISVTTPTEGSTLSEIINEIKTKINKLTDDQILMDKLTKKNNSKIMFKINNVTLSIALKTIVKKYIIDEMPVALRVEKNNEENTIYVIGISKPMTDSYKPSKEIRRKLNMID